MAEALTVKEKLGEYMVTYFIQSEIDNAEGFLKLLEEKLPTLIKGSKFVLRKDSFGKDTIQHLGERVYKLSDLGRMEGEKGGWRCFLQATLY